MNVLEVGIDFVKVEDETENDNKLKEKPLLPDPFDTVLYMDLMQKKKPRFNMKVETLEKCKKRAETEIEQPKLLKASTVADGSVSSGENAIPKVMTTKEKNKQLLLGPERRSQYS